jgi:hypothetical protein
MISRYVMGFLAAALGASGGCDGSRTVIDTSTGAPRLVSSGASPELVAQDRPPIADVPIPTGFSLNERLSHNFSAAGLRNVEHMYDGSSDRFAVGRFFIRQMPIARWVLVSDLYAEGVRTLEFEKEGRGERCHVIIEKGPWFVSTRVTVRLWTSGRIQPGS